MYFKSLAKRGISGLSLVIFAFLFSLSFTYADEPVSPCKGCKADHAPGEAKEIEALIITDKNCSFCSTQMPQGFLKSKFPGIKFETIDYKKRQAKKLIARHKIRTLPCFLISPLIKEEKNFQKLSVLFEEEKAKKILLRKEVSGIYRFLERKEIKGKLDLFLDFYEKGASETLDALISFSREDEIDFDLHFVVSQNKKIGYPKEEVRVALAIRELYPKESNNYLYRRIKDIENSSWIDTAEKEGLSYKKVRDLMTSPEMDKLTSRNKQLAEELMVGSGNAILVKNNRIFTVVNIDKEELRSFFKGGR